jgi:hypothetical protein
MNFFRTHEEDCGNVTKTNRTLMAMSGLSMLSRTMKVPGGMNLALSLWLASGRDIRPWNLSGGEAIPIDVTTSTVLVQNENSSKNRPQNHSQPLSGFI